MSTLTDCLRKSGFSKEEINILETKVKKTQVKDQTEQQAFNETVLPELEQELFNDLDSIKEQLEIVDPEPVTKSSEELSPEIEQQIPESKIKPAEDPESVPNFELENVTELSAQENLNRVETELAKAASKIQSTIGSTEIGKQLTESKSEFIKTLDEGLQGDNKKKLAKVLANAIINSPRVPKALMDALGKEYIDGIRKLAKQREPLAKRRSEELGNRTAEQKASLEEGQLTNERINEMRETLINKETLESYPQTVDAWIKDAFDNNISKDGSMLKEQTIAIKAKNGQVLSAAEQIALASAITNLKVSLTHAGEQLKQAKVLGSHEIGKYKANIRGLEDIIDSLSEALFRAGTNAGRALRVRQEIWSENRFSPERLRVRAKEEAGGKLSDVDSKFMTDKAKQIERLENNRKKWVEKRKIQGPQAIAVVAQSNLNTIIDSKKRRKDKSLADALSKLDTILTKPC